MSKRKSPSYCLCCNSEFHAEYSSQGKYCSVKCQKEFQYEEYIKSWLRGEIDGCVGKTLQLSNHIKKYLRNVRGTSCSICGWDEKHPDDGAILTEFDHVDGDASNNSENNLRILCPNCHSKTSNFRARNKNSKRVRK